MSAAHGFTPEQEEAIARRSGPLALAANAGSGKTSVLVERYVRAVVVDGIAPGRILAITFTDRAAGELRERIRLRLSIAGERGAARESAGAFVSTFHAFCARLLRTHAALVGLTPDFTLLDDAQAVALRSESFAAAHAGWLEREGALDLSSTFGVAELREAIEAVFDELRSRGERAPTLGVPLARHDPLAAATRLAVAVAAVRIELAAAPPGRAIERALGQLDACAQLIGEPGAHSPLRLAEFALRNGSSALASAACGTYEQARLAYEEACADGLGIGAVALLEPLLRSFADRYESAKQRRGVVDYDDLELAAGALLTEHEDVRALWSGRFELLMVDELQDTNQRQMAILAALDRDNLFTVGDEFQSIYGFRHADVALFRERRAALGRGGAARVLSANFRSRKPLLDAVNAVFAPAFGEQYVPLLAGRAGEGQGSQEPLLELLVTDTDGWERHEERLGAELAPAPLWRRAEARLLARRLDQLIRSGAAQPEEIVVLFRAGTAIWIYEAALADLGHATLATAGGGFFSRPEIIDLVAYVRALANPLDELALYGVLASPLCGCSSDVLVGIALRARELGIAAWELLESEPPDARTAAFAARLRAARRAGADRGLGDIVAAAVAENGYDVHLCTLHAPERRVANVHKLERLAREFEAREGRDLRRFALALEQGRVGSTRESEAPPPAAGTGAIRLMTIHSAKGLEFELVCLADLGHSLAERQIPALLVDGGRVGLRLPTPERRSLDTLAYAQLRAQRAAAALAEEQRVIYVAMTRARERLILSGAARFDRWPSESATAMAWLGPALVEDLASRALAAGEGGGGVAVVAAAGGVPLRLTLSTPASADELLGGEDREGGTGAGEVDGVPPAGEPAGRDGGRPAAAGGAVAPAPPAGPGGGPAATALSYTAIAEYERCAYRYHLQRVLGLADVEPPGGGGEGAAARGVIVHALLERLDFAAPRTPTEIDVADAARRSGVALAPGPGRIEIAALAGAFAHSPLCARLAAASDLRREEPFAFVFDGAEMLRGFLDVAAVEPDGTLLIVDYKSDRVAADADLGALIERDYALQRLVYALAGLAAGAPAVEVAHCFLRAPAVLLATRYDAAARPALEARLAAAIAPLRAGRFEVSADPGRERCGSCPGRARLCSHDERMTLREDGAGAAPGARGE